jgi:NitT/TauT family transport system ATP-binding protein
MSVQAAETPLIVELRDVSKAYGATLLSPGRPAIVDVNLSIEDVPDRGQCRVILGPSGCGKSTILRLIAGLIKPTKGDVLVNGSEVKGPGSDRGMVFQSYSSFPWLTVLDNVRFGLDLKGTPRKEGDEIAMNLIQRVGLAGTEQLHPNALSGGMRQRVAIARSLACQPSIILMDEPFGALDPRTRTEMQDLLAALWFDPSINTTIVFVTHDVEEAIFLADRIHVMSAGPGTIIAELEAPPPTQATREGLLRGDFRDLEQHIIELIFGDADSPEVVLSHHHLLGIDKR